MGIIYRYLEAPAEVSSVLTWFRGLAAPPEIIRGGDEEAHIWLYFRSEGPLARHPDTGEIDLHSSPVATLFPPVVRRGVLWTVGEVHFLTSRLRQRFPPLHKICRQLREWLEQHECVLSNRPGFHGEWDYYLEGSVRNYDPPIHALPSALPALRNGQYFVSIEDNAHVLDTLCKTLRRRGVDCSGPP